jgi:Ca2+-binding RTX toxin-like protein
MIYMSRSVSVFSVVVVMTITVLATVVVAFAQEEPENEGGGGPVGKVPVCHNTAHNPHTITVGAPAEAAHLAHGDTKGACETAGAPPEEPSEGATLTTEATLTPTLPDGTISDTATLGADVQDGTDGDIEFKLYGPFTTEPTEATAATDCVAANLVDNPSYTSTVAVDDHTAGDTYPSATYTPTEPGIYQWTATFTPDAGQGDPTSEIGCGETVEQSVVDGDATSTTGTEQNMTLAGEIGEDANLADPATDTTNIEGTTQNGNTTLDTDSVDDVLYGGSSANKLLGRHGNDYLDGGKGRDRMVGGKQADHINGADGKPGDVINGGIGTDYCVGDVGDEIKNCDGNVVNVPLPSEAAAPAEARN